MPASRLYADVRSKPETGSYQPDEVHRVRDLVAQKRAPFENDHHAPETRRETCAHQNIQRDAVQMHGALEAEAFLRRLKVA
jgi:hypothetical protein